ncbi:MAG: hypothetical protein ABR615_10285 [Pseudonocardiaceae bacterium]
MSTTDERFFTTPDDMVPHSLGLRPGLARMVARGETALRRWALASPWWLRREPIIRRTALIRPGVRWLLFGAHPRPADVALCATCLAQGQAANLVTFRSTLDEHDQVAAERIEELVSLVKSDQRLSAE